MNKYVGRNIIYGLLLQKWIITTEVAGIIQHVECNNEALALATLRRLLRNGYHYFDAHSDPTI